MRKTTLIIALAAAGMSLTLFGANPSPLADAAQLGDFALVRSLIDARTDVNSTQSDGSTALHWAVYRLNFDMVNVLIRAGANVKATTRDGATPLSLASTAGNGPIVSALLKAGADANETLPTGKTNLMLSSKAGGLDAMKALMDAGARINEKETLRGTTALMWAADDSQAAAVKLLVERGADVKAKSNGAARARGPALGKSSDPRRNVAEQGARRTAGEAAPPLGFNPDADDAAPTGTQPAVQPAVQPTAQPAARGTGRGGRGNAANLEAGELTPLIYAARNGDIESARALMNGGADVNQTSGYGWSPLLTAAQNRNYKFGAFLLDNGADPNLTNKGGWTPLYLATDNRNIENGDYPVRKPDMDHLDFIKVLIAKGANVNARMKDSTDTRTVFTNQWLDENGATAFLRAAQSGDLVLMKLLLERGADPKINTVLNVTPLQVAAGIGWVEGVTFEWSPVSTFQSVKLLLDLGVDPNIQADTGRTALHGAAHKGNTDVIQTLVDHGAKLDVRDYGNTDNRGGALAVHTWQPVDYADGLVRVGVQSAIPHPEAGLLIRKLMTDRGMSPPPFGRTLDSICITEACE